MDSAGRYGFMQISAHPAYTGSLLQRKLIDEADRSVGFKHLSRKQFVPEDGNERNVYGTRRRVHEKSVYPCVYPFMKKENS